MKLTTKRMGINSIRLKIGLACIVTAAVSIVLVSVTNVLVTGERARETLTSNMVSLTRFAGRNLGEAVASRDEEAAKRILNDLVSHENVSGARIVDGGRTFAQSSQSPSASWPSPGRLAPVAERGDALLLHHPVRNRSGKKTAVLQVRAPLAPLRERRDAALAASGAAGVVALITAMAIVLSVCPKIAGPIEHLAATAYRVCEKGDLNVRAKDDNRRDEIGILVCAFNEMLDHLAHNQRDLQDAVEARTRELEEANDSLRRTVDEMERAKHAAEASNAAKTRFLANMSHELRTPLNAIIGFSQIMRDETLGPNGQPNYTEYAGDIHDSADHLLAVINDLLDTARIQSGQMTLREDSVRLGSIAEGAARVTSITAERRGISLEVSDSAAWRTEAVVDPDRMRQILINLISNALKFTPERGRVDVDAKPAEGGGVLVEVADTGCGMNPDDVPQVLAPFQQAPRGDEHLDEYTKDQGGAGLGLSLCKEIAELHGGWLDIDTEPGSGTTVRVFLPPGRLRHVNDRPPEQHSRVQ